MSVSPPDLVEKIQALTFMLEVLWRRHVRALRAMKGARTEAQFNTALRQANAIDEQIETYRNALFDLTKR